MTNEEIEKIVAEIEVAKVIQREIDSAEYFINALSTRLLNCNVDLNVTKNVLLLRQINVAEWETELENYEITLE